MLWQTMDAQYLTMVSNDCDPLIQMRAACLVHVAKKFLSHPSLVSIMLVHIKVQLKRNVSFLCVMAPPIFALIQ